jgi:hypothetical protein
MLYPLIFFPFFLLIAISSGNIFAQQRPKISINVTMDSARFQARSRVDPHTDAYIKVFPNPGVSFVKIKAFLGLTLRSAQFYDYMGRQIFLSYTLENNLITTDVHNLRCGIYLARINWFGRVDWQLSETSGTFTQFFSVVR